MQRRQLSQRGDAERTQEYIRRAEGHRPSGQVQPSGFLDQPFLHQRLHCGRRIHAPHLLDKGAGHRLIVRNNGQDFQRSRRKRRVAPRVHDIFDIRRISRFGGKLPAVLQLEQHKTAVFGLVIVPQGKKKARYRVLLHPQHARQAFRRDRLGMSEQHGLYRGLGLFQIHFNPLPLLWQS